MTNMKTIIAGAALFAIAASANAQQASTAGTVTVSATLLSPITVETGLNMGFGSIVITSAAGSVVLSTQSTRAATGATLGNDAGTAAAAVNIGGVEGGLVSVKLGGQNNNEVVLINSVDTNKKLTLTDFTIRNAAAGAETAYAAEGFPVTLGANGNSTVRIGGKLNIPANSPAGSYSTAGGSAMTVTVNYN